MSAVLIPVVPEGAYFGLGVELDGKTYRLDFRWNPRCEQWVLNVLDGGGGVVVQGVRVVIDVPLLQRFGPRVDLPPGLLMFVDSSGDQVDAGLTDLGSRVQLFYLPAGDLP